MPPDQTDATPSPAPLVPPPAGRPPTGRGPLTLFLLLALAAFAVVSGGYVVGKALLKVPAALKRELPRGPVLPGGGGKISLKVPTGMQKFTSYEELREFLAEHADAGGTTYYRSDWDTGFESFGAAPQSLQRASPSSGELGSIVNQGLSYSTIVGWGTSGGDYSTTNVQVAGVDEGDLIKTDGRYLYTVSGNNVFIVDAYPPEQGQVLVKIQFDSTPTGLYVNGNRLAVYGRDYNIQSSTAERKFPRRGSYTFLKVFDISDHRSPRQVRDLSFEGDLASSRMIGPYVYLLTTSPSWYDGEEPPIPRILEDSRELPTTPGTSRCNCPDVYYFDPDGEGYSFTSVAAVNVLDDRTAVSSDLYLVTPGQTVYVSPTHLYVTATKRVSKEVLLWEVLREHVLPLLSERDRARIAKIEAVDNAILSRSEKFAKISRILQRYEGSMDEAERQRLESELRAKVQQRWQEVARELEQTVIHKIALQGSDLSYRASGAVPGYVLNQFALDEHEGYLRIATTRSQTWSEFDQGRSDSYSNLYILDEQLRLSGKVEGLAKGERIFAVRFMQGRAYLVTFRQTDPLFTIDVRDPRNPRVLGELKVPGFSDYLHPYDDATLIGLGQESGTLKLSLFDVADVSAPRELSRYLFAEYGSDSTARREHKAFLFSKEKNLLVIPLSTRETFIEPQPLLDCPPNTRCSRPYVPPRYFNGAAVFSVDRGSGFALRGKIDHPQTAHVQPLSPGVERIAPSYALTVEIKRSLYIKDILYTFSDQFIKANRLGDLGEVKYLKLEKQPSGDVQIIN